MTKIIKIGLSAGHGLYTAGKRCLKSIDPKETREWVLNDRIAVKIEEKLKGYEGIEIHRLDDRTGQRDVPLKERTDMANSLKLDFVDDIHHNAGINGGSGGGITVIRHHITGQSTKDYQDIMYDKIIKHTGLKGNRSNPKPTQNLHMCRETDMSTLTAEHGFMDSTTDVPIILTEKFAEQCANAHVEFYVEVFNLKKKKVPVVGGESNMIYRIRKEWVDATTQKGAYSSLENAISTAKSLDGYKVFDNNGKQVYPEVVKKNEHWAKKHYDNLISKGFKFVDTEFDKEVALGNVYKLFDELTNNVVISEPNNKKEPEIENDVIEILQIEYKRVLKHGMKGEDIRKLQVALVELGYDPKGIDGVFGNGCLASVKTFQRNSGLVVDGLFGLASYNKINELLRRKSDGEAVSSPRIKYEVLRPDSQTTVVKIPHKNIKEIKTIIANNKSKSETLQSMKNRTGVDLIINGGLFYYSDKYKDNHSLNLLVHEGKTIVAGTYSRYSLMTEKDGSYEFGWYSWNKDRVTGIGGSPALIVDGKINLDKGSLDNNIHNSKHPRSAIGMNNTHFFMVVIDGRKPSSNLYGMTNKELAEFMLNKLKCTSAIGLDGGLSSTLIGDNILNKSYTGRGLHNGLGIKLK